MALVDPNIAMSFRAPEIKPRNALAEYAQMQQIVGGQRQAEVAELQLDALRQEREALKGIQEAIVAKGGPPDLGAAADAMIKTGRPEYLAKGIQIRQMVANQNAWSDYQKQFLSPESAAPASAPSAGDAPANVLAPTAATPPVNALAAPDIRSLENRYRMVAGLDTPGAKAEASLLEKQIAEARTSARPTADQRMMQILGLPPTPQGYAQFKSMSSQPEVMRLAQELGAMAPNDPMRKFYQDRLTKLTTHAPPSVVHVPPQEKAERSARGQLLVDQYKDISKSAQVAAKALPALETQERVLDAGFRTGFGAAVQTEAARVLTALGVPNAKDYATNSEVFSAAASQAVLQRQLEQKGVQTEADTQRISQTGAQLGNTPEGNKFILAVARAQFKNDINQRNFYDAWWKKNGTYDGAEDAWFSGPGSKSLFESSELKQFAAPKPKPDERQPLDSIFKSKKP